jgi:hypothetical protein
MDFPLCFLYIFPTSGQYLAMKNPFIPLLICFWVLFLGSEVFAQRGGGDFGPYQVILDRQLLGRPEPVEPPAARPPPAAPPPSWAVEYRLTMITEDMNTGRARVGLYHVRNQTGYLLLEGEEFDGFRLHSVNFENNRAEISFQGTRHTFTIDSAPAAASAPEPRANIRQPAAPTSVRRVSRSVSSSNEPPSVPEPPAEPRFSSPEELQAHLQNVQMDAIRSGKPPLPIPLTPEMDAQLVREGVLPPLED